MSSEGQSLGKLSDPSRSEVSFSYLSATSSYKNTSEEPPSDDDLTNDDSNKRTLHGAYSGTS